MNTHTIQAERAVYAGTALSDHKELEIEREILLQTNKVNELEETVAHLLSRLSSVMRSSEPNVVGGLEVGVMPAPNTALGESLRNTSVRVDSIKEQVAEALRRLELS